MNTNTNSANINSIHVSYDSNIFSLVDPITGETKQVNSGKLHTKLYITDTSIKEFFLKQFPGKTSCICTPEAEERINSIADWNYLYE